MNRHERRAAASGSAPTARSLERNAHRVRRAAAPALPPAASVQAETASIAMATIAACASARNDVLRESLAESLGETADSDQIVDYLLALLAGSVDRYSDASDQKDAVRATVAVSDLVNIAMVLRHALASVGICGCERCEKIRTRLSAKKSLDRVAT